jgi:hypothetical protein
MLLCPQRSWQYNVLLIDGAQGADEAPLISSSSFTRSVQVIFLGKCDCYSDVSAEVKAALSALGSL